MTFVCVPIMVRDAESALAEATEAKRLGADLVEFRLDSWFAGSDDPDDAHEINECVKLVGASPLPCIATCRPTWEGGLYDGPEDMRISLFEALGTSDRPPAYIDVELKAYTASKNIKQKINLAVEHPKQQRDVHTRLILSMHDFEGRPSDLTRKLAKAYAEPAASIVKVAFRARSLRDNLELFEILREAQKPTIALGMGEFGLMSRVLAPKFGGFLTFASLRKEEVTAPGQPTIDELLNLYRFRSIGKDTKLYGVIGWPVGHSMSPLIHNAGFAEVGHDGVYLPMPVAADAESSRPGFESVGSERPAGSDEGDLASISFGATVNSLIDDVALRFCGASVTIPFKVALLAQDYGVLDDSGTIGAANTLRVDWEWYPSQDGVYHEFEYCYVKNTDVSAIVTLIDNELESVSGKNVALYGTGGVARAAAMGLAMRGATVTVVSRDPERANAFAGELDACFVDRRGDCGRVLANTPAGDTRLFINCTPVGMAGGPDPDGLSIPVPDMVGVGPETVFFDTVYNPIETPMLRAARERGCRTIDGVQMFVKQAAAQFELWTRKPAPVELFDRLVREALGPS